MLWAIGCVGRRQSLTAGTMTLELSVQPLRPPGLRVAEINVGT